MRWQVQSCGKTGVKFNTLKPVEAIDGVAYPWKERPVKNLLQLLHGEEGPVRLSLRRKRGRKRSRVRQPLPEAVAANQMWSVDFMTDALSSGRKFCILNVVDDYTRECLAIEVDTSLGGVRVVRVLEELKQRHGLRRQIRSDNVRTTEGLEWHAIQPGRPMENGYVESFNGRFRDEGLNENWFRDLADARTKIDDWQQTTTRRRPHSSLQYRTPKEFTAEAASWSHCCNVPVVNPLSYRRGV
jgi:putative transposase